MSPRPCRPHGKDLGSPKGPPQARSERISMKTDYNGLGKIQYILAEMDLPILNTEYTDSVELVVLIPVWKFQEFEKRLTEATAGKGVWEELAEVDYVRPDKEVILI